MKKQSLCLFCALIFVLSFKVAFSQVCPSSQVVYPYGTTPEGILVVPGGVYYNDNTQPPQYKDSGGNLIVTWPHGGYGYYVGIAFSSEGYAVINTPLTIGSQPLFTATTQFFCNSQTGTFTISDVCGTLFTWAAPAGWSINGGGNVLTTSSKSVNITAPSTGIGNVQISATSNNNYAGAVIANVWLGRPVFNSISVDGSTSPVPLCGGGNYISYTSGQAHVLSTPVSGTASVTFALSGASGVTGSAISATSYEFASSSSTASFTITATATNSCGTISQCLPFYNVSGGSGGGGGGGGGCSSFAISPNPSSSTLRVVVPDKPAPCNSTQLSTNLLSSQVSSPSSETSGNENTLTIQSVSLYSLDGQPQFTKQFSDNTKIVDLDISGLKKGVYILRISDGVSHNEVQRIIIN